MMLRSTFLISVVAAAATAFAQSTQTPSQFVRGDATLDLAVPESPAFSALDLTPQQVSRPTGGRELATSLLNGVDRNGNLQTGIAVDTAPAMLLAGSRITLDQYRDQYLTRFLARWQVSFATSKGGGSDDPAAKVALGMRFTLFDHGDPRTDEELLECLAAEETPSTPVSPWETDEQIAIENLRREEALRRRIGPCRERASKRRWNRSAWVVGMAPTWTSPDGTTAQLEHSGTALWTSIGFGFERVPVLEDHAMVAGYVKARSGEVSPDQLNPGNSITQDNVTAGGRFIVGVPTTQVNVEALWIRNDRVDMLEDRYWNLGFGFEQRVAENIWLNLSFGRQLAREEFGHGFVVLTGFNWGLGAR